MARAARRSAPQGDDFQIILTQLPALAKLRADDPATIDWLLEEKRRARMHREKMEEKDLMNQRLGMVLGFIIALVFLILSAYLLLNRHDPGGTAAGTIIGSGDIVALVGTFVFGQRQQRKAAQTVADQLATVGPPDVGADPAEPAAAG